jgi:ribosomal protein S27AE
MPSIEIKLERLEMQVHKLEQWCPECVKPALIEADAYYVVNDSKIVHWTARRCGSCDTKWDQWPWPVTYEVT